MASASSGRKTQPTRPCSSAGRTGDSSSTIAVAPPARAVAGVEVGADRPAPLHRDVARQVAVGAAHPGERLALDRRCRSAPPGSAHARRCRCGRRRRCATGAAAKARQRLLEPVLHRAAVGLRLPAVVGLPAVADRPSASRTAAPRPALSPGVSSMPCALDRSAPSALATTSSSRSRAPSMSPIWRNSSASSSLRASGSPSAARRRRRRRRAMLKSPKSSASSARRRVGVGAGGGVADRASQVAEVEVQHRPAAARRRGAGRRAGIGCRRRPRSSKSSVASSRRWQLPDAERLRGLAAAPTARLDGPGRGRGRDRASMPPSSVASAAGSEARRRRQRRVRHRRSHPAAPPAGRSRTRTSSGWPPGWYSGLSGSIWQAQFLRLGPVLALAARQAVQLRGQQLEALGVAPLGIDLEQLGADGQALRRGAHRFLEDLLGLQVAAVGQVDVGLGHRVDVADGVELAQRIAHRRRTAAGGAASRVSMRWPPLAPKNESGCRRLSRNEVSPLPACATRPRRRYRPRPASRATSTPAPGSSSGLLEQRVEQARLFGGAAGAGAGRDARQRRAAVRRRWRAGGRRRRLRARGAAAATARRRRQAPAPAAAAAGAGARRLPARALRPLAPPAAPPLQAACSSSTLRVSSASRASRRPCARAALDDLRPRAPRPWTRALRLSVSLSGVGGRRLLAVVDRGLHLAAGLARRAARGLRGRHARGQALAVGGEIGALRLDDLARLGGVDAAWPPRPTAPTARHRPSAGSCCRPMKACGLARNSDTSIWSSETPARLRATGDARLSVSPGLHPVAVGRGRPAARPAAVRRAGARRRARRGPGRRAAARLGAARRRRGGGAGAGAARAAAAPRGGAAAVAAGGATAGAAAGAGAARARCRRVEQQRVLAHQAARCPGELRGSRRRRAPARRGRWSRAATGGRRRGAASCTCGAGQHGVVVDAGGAVGVGRRHAQLQRRRLFGVRLVTSISARRVSPSADCTVRRPRPSAQALRAPQTGRGQRHPGQRKARRARRTIFQGISQRNAAGPCAGAPADSTSSARAAPESDARGRLAQERKSQQHQAYRRQAHAEADDRRRNALFPAPLPACCRWTTRPQRLHCINARAGCAACGAAVRPRPTATGRRW